MFRRENHAENHADLEPEPVTPEPAPREKVDAKDAKIFTTGHTFAERKAAADAHNAELGRQRLVSLGETEFTQRGNRGEVEVLPATLYADFDHPAQRYVKIAGLPGLHPLNSDQRRDGVVELPPIPRGRRGPSALATPSAPEPPPRRI